MDRDRMAKGMRPTSDERPLRAHHVPGAGTFSFGTLVRVG